MVNNNWLELPLGDVITLQRGFDLPNQERKLGNIPIVSSSGINGTHSEAKISAPGVVTGRYGTIGQVFYIKEDFWPLNTTLFVKDFKGNNPLFVSFLLRTIDFLSCSDKSSVPGLNRNDLHLIKVKLPPVSEQKAIAHILGTLDDKIELNREMNRTLEAMARAIFKSWFVDFDPVRAKMEGRQPAGMDTATAELFPDEFEESLVGKIPKEWKIGCFGDIANNPRRGVQAEKIPASTPYIGLEHMPRQSIALSDWASSEEVASNKFWFKQGDILFGKLRPYFHKVGVAVLDGVCSTDILVIVPKLQDLYGLVLFQVSSNELVDYTNATSTGTRMPRTNWDDMARYELVVPKFEIAKVFNQQVQPLVQVIRSNIFQSRTLTDMRDTLLPKLLSGEIRVKEAEKIVEIVA